MKTNELVIRTVAFDLSIFFKKLELQIEREKNRDRPVTQWINTLEGYFDMESIAMKNWKKDFVVIDEITYMVGGCSLPHYVVPTELKPREISELFMATFFSL